MARRPLTLPLGALSLVLALLTVAGCTATAAPTPPTLPTSPAGITAPAEAPGGTVDMLVPNVLGRRADNAESVISASGFTVVFSQPVADPTRLIVIAQQPAGGATGTRGSTVLLTVAEAPAGSPPTGPLTTPVGLTFDIAEAACDAHGRVTSALTATPADGWNAVFSVTRSRLEGDLLVLVGDVLVTRPDGRPEPRTVDCTVGGRDISPVVEAFWVH